MGRDITIEIFKYPVIYVCRYKHGIAHSPTLHTH